MLLFHLLIVLCLSSKTLHKTKIVTGISGRKIRIQKPSNEKFWWYYYGDYYDYDYDYDADCHDSCWTCDGPNDGDCLSCYGGLTLSDDDGDGAGECVPGDLCAPGCFDSWIGDGWCDPECENTACGDDAGDCDGTDWYNWYDDDGGDYWQFDWDWDWDYDGEYNNNGGDYNNDEEEDESSLAGVSEGLVSAAAGVGMLFLIGCGIKKCCAEDAPQFNCVGKGRIIVYALTMIMIMVSAILNRNASMTIDMGGWGSMEFHVGYLTYWTKVDMMGESETSTGDLCNENDEDPSGACVFGAAATAFSIGACAMITLAIMFSFCNSKFWCMTMITNFLATGATLCATGGCIGVYADVAGDDETLDIGASVILMIVASVFVSINFLVHCCNGGFKKENNVAAPASVEITGKVTTV